MKITTSEKTLNRYIDLFEKNLERNKSKNTIINYVSDLNQFITYLNDNDMDYVLDNFDKEDFLDYIDCLKNKFAPATVHRKAISLNEFLTYLNRTGRLKKTPFINGKELKDYLPVIPKRKIDTLSKSQVRNMIFVSGDLFRECLIRTFYDTGARVSEMAAAKWSDIEGDWSGDASVRFILTIRGKGKGGMSKERTVRISPKTMEKLEEMKLSRSYNSEYIFESERTKKPFTTRRLDQIVKELGSASGIEEINTHIFRKSVATNLLENGMPVEYVAEYLGHENIQTTIRNYVDTTKSLHDKVDKAFGEEI